MRLASPTGSSILTNDTLNDALFSAQSTGLSAQQADRYDASATVWFDPKATADEVTALKGRLTAAGYTGMTVADRLGTVTTVIDVIVLVLNAFAVIALLAGRVRDRQHALHVGAGAHPGDRPHEGDGHGLGTRVHALQSRGRLPRIPGSAIGAVVAMIVGTGVSAALSHGLLSGLPGLTLIAFDPSRSRRSSCSSWRSRSSRARSTAARAARADPVDSLRYE